MNQYVAVGTVCPFAIKEEQQKLHCEGFQKGTILHTWFKTKDLRDAHKLKYCGNLKGYTKCPIYRLVIEKYKENEDEVR